MRLRPLASFLILVVCCGLIAQSTPVAAESPENELDLPLVTPQEKQASRERSRGNHGVIEFDLRRALERRFEAPPQPGRVVDQIPGGDGAWFDPDNAPLLGKNFGGHYFINDPTTGIYPRHVRLQMNFTKADGDSSLGGCSGTLISPRHIITAAHCVYTFQSAADGQSRGPWAAQIIAYPGWNGAAGPAGQAIATDLRTWTSWTDNADYDGDIALITLSRPLGALVGWDGAGASSNWDQFDSSTWDMYAYPGRNFDLTVNLGGNRMYQQTGNYDYDDYPQVGSDMPSYRGTSGGGAVKNGAVWAVRSHFENPWPGDVDMYDTAITHSRLGTILSWIEQDRPDAADLLPLDVRASAIDGEAGDTLSNFDFLVHNLGESTHTGGVAYTVYIGTNNVTNLSTDTYVTSGFASGNISAGGTLRVTVPALVIPPQLTAGDYFLGVFITTVDADFGNNMTRSQDTVPFAVTCANQEVPLPVFPVDGHPCVPTNITLNWGSIAGVGVQYEVTVEKANGLANPWSETVVTGSTQHTFFGLTEGLPYEWQVRALTACGGTSAWSEIFIFTTEGFLSPVVQLLPPPGEACVDINAQLQWNPIPNADQYRIRLENITRSTVQILDTPDLFYDLTGIIAGDEYEWKVKGRDPCLAWGTYGEVWTFYTKDVPAADAVPIAPINSAFASSDPVLACLVAPGVLDYHYELKEEENPLVIATHAGESNWQVEGLLEGPYEWRARALSCTVNGEVFGAWSAWQGFRVDTTAPFFTTPPTAISPPVNSWTSNTLVTVQWSAASDAWSGVSEYWVSYDQSPSTVPNSTTTSPTPGAWEFVGQDGQNWFHIVAVDQSGNVSAPQHLGPFLIDTGPPSVPVPVANLDPDAWTNVDDINVSWPPSTDPGSGVVGYSFAWSNLSTYVLDDTVDTPSPQSSLTPASEGSQYFYVRSVDLLGNASAVVMTRYLVDRSAPTFMNFNLDGGQVFSTGQMAWVDYMTNDISGPAQVVTEHFYSIDSGNFWYYAECAGSCSPPPGSCQGTGSSPECRHFGNGFGPYQWRVPWVPPDSELLYRILAVDQAGNVGERISLAPFFVNTATGVGPTPGISRVALLDNTPNPFNPRTIIRYEIPKDTHVELTIFDLAGRRVANLVSETQNGPARHEAIWDGLDSEGRRVSSGVYLYQLRAGDLVETKRMALVK